MFCMPSGWSTERYTLGCLRLAMSRSVGDSDWMTGFIRAALMAQNAHRRQRIGCSNCRAGYDCPCSHLRRDLAKRAVENLWRAGSDRIRFCESLC
jgi:hypothetical protein